jgi:hypothetical protein
MDLSCFNLESDAGTHCRLRQVEVRGAISALRVLFNSQLIFLYRLALSLSRLVTSAFFGLTRPTSLCEHFVVRFASGKDVGHQIQDLVLGQRV